MVQSMRIISRRKADTNTTLTAEQGGPRMDIGAVLKQLRREQNLTQEKLAEMLGVKNLQFRSTKMDAFKISS